MSAWHVYVWVFSVVLVASAAGRQILLFKEPEHVSRFDVAEGYFALLAIPALFGFADQRAYGSHAFWIGYCSLFLGLNVYSFFTPKMKTMYRRGWRPALLTVGTQIAVGFPALWALVKYSLLNPDSGVS